MLEGSLRENMYSGPLGGSCYQLREWFSGGHGPFYIMLQSETEFSALVMPFKEDKEAAIAIIQAAYRRGMITDVERAMLLGQLYTIPEYIRAYGKKSEAPDGKKA